MKLFSERTSKILMISGIVLFLIGLGLFLHKSVFFDSNLQIDAAKFGQFGDYVGGLIGSLWAFAGVILFYVALKEQREDIRTNRDVLRTQVSALEQQIREFELQREELELTRKVFIDQSKTLKLQQFESTFFNSMNLLNNIINSINYIYIPPPTSSITSLPGPDKTKVYNGRDSFEFFFNDLKKEYNSLISEYTMRNIKTVFKKDAPFDIPFAKIEEFANTAYLNFFNKHSDLGHYFRTIYNIVKFVKERSPENPKYYTNLLRSQLSTFEHLLLFYNCYSALGNEKFKPLIISFSMLNNMSTDKLIDLSHESFYPEEAYT